MCPLLGFASRVDVYCVSTSQWPSSRRHSQLLWGEVGGMEKEVCNGQVRMNKWVVKACTSAGEMEKDQKDETHNTHISCNALFCAPIFLLSLCYARLNRARAKKKKKWACILCPYCLCFLFVFMGLTLNGTPLYCAIKWSNQYA